MNQNIPSFEVIEGGGVTSASGFEAAGVTCGLKRSGKADLALLYSRTGCNSAGTFTSNLFPAAPVVLCKERVAGPAGIKEGEVGLAAPFESAGDAGGLESGRGRHAAAFDHLERLVVLVQFRYLLKKFWYISSDLPDQGFLPSVAVMVRAMPPRGRNSPLTSIHRGLHAFTMSVRMRLTASSWNVWWLRKE